MNMKLEDVFPPLKAHWKLEVFEGDSRDKLLQTIEGENLVVTVGKQMILDRLFGLSAVGAMTRIGAGTSGTAAALGDTALTGATFKTYADGTPSRLGSVVTCTALFLTGDANFVWRELGMDNGTTLLNRFIIAAFTKTSAVSVIVTCVVTQA